MKRARTNSPGGIHNWTLAAGLLALAVILLLPHAGRAGAPVSARYVKAGDAEIVLEISTTSRAPSTIIVTQHLPGGTEISESAPRLNSYRREQGEAKWLLTDMMPGVNTLRITLAAPLKGAKPSGEVRYRDPGTGAMITFRVSP